MCALYLLCAQEEEAWAEESVDLDLDLDLAGLSWVSLGVGKWNGREVGIVSSL